MTMLHPEAASKPRWDRLIKSAVSSLQSELEHLDLAIDVFPFERPPVSVSGGLAEPLDYLELGLAEKLERRINFLLIVTEGELSTTRLSYAVAFPSRLTNVGVVSIRRLLPDSWGHDADDATAGARLGILLIHTFGHILNLGHHQQSDNVMYDFASVVDLDIMDELTPEQRSSLARNLPDEAHDETTRGRSARFWWRTVSQNTAALTGTLARANPVRLMGKLPTLLTTALSIVIVLFFSAEVWDVADAVAIYQIVLFTLFALGISVFVLYRTFGFGALLDRQRLVSESTVVTETATLLAVAATMTAVFVLFFTLTYVAAVTIFPRRLMAEWASIDAANDPLDHIKLGLLLAGMAVLTGSLGGRADSKRLVQTILFLDEET